MLETNIINTCCELFFFLMKLDIKTDWPLKTCGSCFTMFGSEGKNDKRIHSCFPSPLINSSLLTTNYKKRVYFQRRRGFFWGKDFKMNLKRQTWDFLIFQSKENEVYEVCVFHACSRSVCIWCIIVYFTNVFYKSSVKSRYGISVNWLN